jgi:D-lyxose ketol-isomerase
MLLTTPIAQRKILEMFDEEQLKDIAEYGCESGCASGFIYYHETSAFFDRHNEEIEEYLENVFGEDYLTNFASRATSMKTLKNLMCWAFVEMVAQDSVHN